MKILHIINSLNIGGAETLITNYLIYAKNNIKTDINDLCILYDSDTFLYDRLFRNGITIYNLRLKHKYDIGAIFKLIRLINEEKYDIVHVHLFPALYFCSIASYFTKKINYIFTEHSNYNSRRKYIIFKSIDYFFYRKYRKIICVSDNVKNELIKWLPSLNERSVVIYNGILEKRGEISFIEKNFEYDILFVGSLRSNVKGADILLMALRHIMNKFDKAVIVGDGKLKNDLINLRNKLGLKNKVEFLGFREDIETILEKSKVFVLPSRWEGFGLVIVEAMSKGKPIIASNVGGIPEIIKNGKTGILVEPGNELELANAIEKLLNNKKYAAYLGENAYNDAINRFSIETYVKNLRKLYMSLKI
ncbi:glycosyltransferase family 4 protein [Thermoanaerobacterium aotearoense]|nr:glycosyltransferase family 4 protein [Thermoanaerobacterium aotearoense]